MDRNLTLLLAVCLAATCAGCADDGAGGAGGDAGPTADMASGDMADRDPAADAAADQGVSDADPADQAVEPADAGPRPTVLHPGWCVRTTSEAGAPVRVTTRRYDAEGRLIDEVGDAVRPDATDFQTTWAWDDQDRLIAKTVRDQTNDRVSRDETYRYTADGLLLEAVHVSPVGETLRWTLDASNGKHTALRAFVDDVPAMTYETLEWDLAADRLLARNTHLTANDEIVAFAQYTYKPRNPGMGKIESEARDQSFQDGVVDVRERYTYEPTMAILSGRSTQLFARDGSPTGDVSETLWDHLLLSGLHEVRSMSVDGEVRQTYRQVGDQVEVTAGCTVETFRGRIAERRHPGGLAGFSPSTGGAPRFEGASATFEPEGPKLRRVECDGTVSYAIEFDDAGNVIRETDGDFVSDYSYDCWE